MTIKDEWLAEVVRDQTLGPGLDIAVIMEPDPPTPATPGPAGLSAYDVAVLGGYVGTQAQWLASLVGPKGDTGLKGDTGVKGDTGTPGVNSFGTPTARTLALATAYQATNTAKPAVVTVTLHAQSAISLGGASNNEGAIVVGPTNAVAAGTGTSVATYRNNLGGTLVVGLNLQSTQANTYTVALPAGWYFAIRQTLGSGLNITSAFDQAVG